MRRNLKSTTLAALLFTAVAFGARAEGGGSWSKAFGERLESSSSYLSARLALRTAELAYEKLSSPFAPTITLSTQTATAPIHVSADGITSGSLTAAATIKNIFGAEVSAKLPLIISQGGGMELARPAISVTRQIFRETDAERLEAESELLRARAAVKDIEDEIRLALASDILNASYYQLLLSASEDNLKVLSRVRKATVSSDASILRELDKRILEARKTILAATGALREIKTDVADKAESLYSDVLSLQDEWSSISLAREPASSLRIQSLERALEASEKRKAFSVLAYLPNPSVSAGLSYDLDSKKIGWDLSFSVSYDIFNSRDAELDALKRRENPAIRRIELDDAKSEMSKGIRRIRASLESLQLDWEIQELEIAEAKDDVALAESLYKGGYISEEDLVIAKIDLSVEELSRKKIEQDLLIEKLRLAKYNEP